MSKIKVLDFLDFCASKSEINSRINDRNLPELIFHAKVMGYNFSAEELTSVVGTMEWHIITKLMSEELNAYSSLWPRMWGKPRLQYVIDELYARLSKDKWIDML